VYAYERALALLTSRLYISSKKACIASTLYHLVIIIIKSFHAVIHQLCVVSVFFIPYFSFKV
ncbi:MAG: hypothetical protein AAFO91_16035, partial [Bacteroidota bacterium]